MDNDKTVRERLQDLEKDYEETRQAWNATDSHEKRLALSERLNEIRETQYQVAEENDDNR